MGITAHTATRQADGTVLITCSAIPDTPFDPQTGLPVIDHISVTFSNVNGGPYVFGPVLLDITQDPVTGAASGVGSIDPRGGVITAGTIYYKLSVSWDGNQTIDTSGQFTLPYIAPTVGYAAPCFNAVLEAVRAAAEATTIAVDPLLVFPAAQPMMGLECPNIQISLPGQPYESDVWGGTGNLKNSLFKIDVHVVTELIQEKDTPTGHPYGDELVPGLLTIADSVEDALEAAYSNLLAASPRVVDVMSATVAHGRLVSDARQIVATIEVIFKIRFFAGRRSA